MLTKRDRENQWTESRGEGWPGITAITEIPNRNKGNVPGRYEVYKKGASKPMFTGTSAEVSKEIGISQKNVSCYSKSGNLYLATFKIKRIL